MNSSYDSRHYFGLGRDDPLSENPNKFNIRYEHGERMHYIRFSLLVSALMIQ